MATRLLVYGPYADEYSLAKVNRNLALGLAQEISAKSLPYEVKLTANPAEVAKTADKRFNELYPELKDIVVDYDPDDYYDIVLYNNFPKDPNARHGLTGLPGRVKLAHIAWEEDRFPQRWVEEFNSELTAVLAASAHTQRVLERSGVRVPVVLMPIAFSPAIEQLSTSGRLAKQESKFTKSSKGFKFLHISSGFERKAPGELITAFAQEFRAQDDIALVIKSFQNPNNRFSELIAEARAQADCPEIEFIVNEELTDDEIAELTLACDVYVSPSKAEGFNLPVLESMALQRPVVATAWSGHMDFCSDFTTYLVDYELAPARSHLDNPGAYWAEPAVADLRAKLRQAFEEKGSQSQQEMIARAHQVASGYTWRQSAAKFLALIPDILAAEKIGRERLGIVSTWNTICGIAEYSSYLYASSQGSFTDFIVLANRDAVGRVAVDGPEVQRVWEYGETDFSELLSGLDATKEESGNFPVDLIHVQYSEGFYTLSALASLLNGLIDRGIKTILTAHAVQIPGAELGQITETLTRVQQIQVLNQLDSEYLRALGLQNVVYMPHGSVTFPRQSRARLRRKLGLDPDIPIVSTHGFMSEGKGILEGLRAIAEVVKDHSELIYIALNAVNPRNMTSQGMSEQFEELATELGIAAQTIHIPDFLDREDVMAGLAVSDVSLFAYPEAKQTASGAVRLALAASVPIIASTSSQLADLAGTASITPSLSPADIAASISKVLADKKLAFELAEKAFHFSHSHSWQRISLSYLALLARIA